MTAPDTSPEGPTREEVLAWLRWQADNDTPIGAGEISAMEAWSDTSFAMRTRGVARPYAACARAALAALAAPPAPDAGPDAIPLWVARHDARDVRVQMRRADVTPHVVGTMHEMGFREYVAVPVTAADALGARGMEATPDAGAVERTREAVRYHHAEHCVSDAPLGCSCGLVEAVVELIAAAREEGRAEHYREVLAALGVDRIGRVTGKIERLTADLARVRGERDEAIHLAAQLKRERDAIAARAQ